MKQEKIINLADEWLKSVPDLRKRIRLIDVALKKDTYDTVTIKELQQERHSLKYKLSKIIKAVSTLTDENQRIICYRYFDNLKYTEIARRVGHSHNTVSQRCKKLLLDIGRIMFGFEDEFFMQFD